MDFAHTDDQEALRAAAREVLTKQAGPAAFRRVMDSETGFDEALWKQIAELGWLGVAVAEEQGGLGLGLVESAILFEEAGRGLLPAPFMSTVGLAGSVASGVEEGGRPVQSFLNRIAAGETIATLALTEPSGRFDPAGVTATAEIAGDAVRLSGSKAFVPDAHVADELLVVARTGEGITLVLVPRDALSQAPEPAASLDGTRRLCTVSLDGVSVGTDAILGEPGRADEALARGLDRAVLAVAAEAVGVCSAVLDLSVAYTKEREQFGRPIGSFQAVSHRVADQMVKTESARSTLYYAAWALEEATPDAPLAVATAKAAAGDAARFVTNSGIQVHGGIGFTWEADLHLYYRRAKWDELFLGDTAYWRDRIAVLLASA